MEQVSAGCGWEVARGGGGRVGSALQGFRCQASQLSCAPGGRGVSADTSEGPLATRLLPSLPLSCRSQTWFPPS
jgi:hypothetical protein